MTNVTEIVRSLHSLERKALPALAKQGKMSQVVHKLQSTDIEVLRALQWLAAKNAVELSETSFEVLALGENGKLALKDGFAEKKFLKAIKESAKTKDQLKKDGLSDEEINASIGLLRQKGAMQIAQTDKGLGFTITEAGLKMLHEKTPEELLINKIEHENLQLTDLNAGEKKILENLKKRKNIIIVSLKKDFEYKLTDLGSKLQKEDLTEVFIAKLTPEMLANGSWKDKEFRPYDINTVVQRKQKGKRHFLNQARSSAKRIWLDMGFVEMTGNMVQTSFWNFDALFTAQDHPVREMQDTFFIKNPKTGKLPDKKLVEKIKAVHENGGDTGSTGWKYSWNEESSKQNVLRTHTTVLSVKTLARIKEEKIPLPAKYFALGKCFRNETLDWSHLFEFNQTEGIVIDKDANFCNLLGYLKIFFAKMGYEKARFRPAYFPYTEFSVEVDVFHPVHKKWLELGGAGIFRPEVVKPLLGIDVPVLAWGPGFDRIIIDYFKITDIRDLYKNDLKQIREIKEWLR